MTNTFYVWEGGSNCGRPPSSHNETTLAAHMSPQDVLELSQGKEDR